MGLDFHNADAHWSYGGFHRFRSKLAGEVGINLDGMVGFGGSKKWDTFDDAIKGLLNHSDCDGEISPRECSIIAPRLRELIENWDDNDYDKIHAKELADGMKYCAKAKVYLGFC